MIQLPIPPIHVTVQQAPTPLWTILSPLILSGFLAAATIYYAWRMHQLAAAEKKRRDKEDDFRAEAAQVAMYKLQIGLKADQPVVGQMRAVLAWTDAELSRLIENASRVPDFTATDLEVIMSTVGSMKALARRPAEAGSVDAREEAMWLKLKTALLGDLVRTTGVVVRAE